MSEPSGPFSSILIFLSLFLPTALALSLSLSHQMMAAVSVTSLKLLHLPFSTSISSRQLAYHHLPLKSQINNGNLVVCKGKSENYNVEMVLDEDDPADLYVDIFERDCAKTGLAQEWRRRKFHETAKEERKRKSRDQARNRARDRR